MFWVGVVLAVPMAYASLYAAEGGPPQAEGCSGAGPMSETGVTGLYAEAEEPVANDGFVMITAVVQNMDVDAALSNLTLEVHDAAGNVVDGTTKVLFDHAVTTGLSHVSIGWWANALREPGEILALRASVVSDVRSVELVSQLVVHDVDPVLVLPEFEAISWSEITDDAGSSQLCPGAPSSCVPSFFGADTFVGRSLSLSAPPVSEVEVGWLYQFEMVPSKGTFVETPPLHAAIAHTSFTAQLSFSQVLPEYCVRLVGRDPRTDEELSREWCMTPEPPIEALNHDGIALCQIAPPGFEERWCRTKQANGAIPPPECDTFLDASGGAGGQPGSSGAGDAGRSDDPPPAGDDASAGESASDTSGSIVRTNAGCGCRTGRTTTTPAALLVLAGAWIALARRRTLRSRSA
jgi:hypothetical protein